MCLEKEVTSKSTVSGRSICSHSKSDEDGEQTSEQPKTENGLYTECFYTPFFKLIECSV